MTIATVDAARRTKVVSACSFDVFDTFLVRACTTSDGVFERTYELSSLSKSCPNVSENFVQQRIQAEARARAHAKETRGCAEVHIGEIYAYFPFRLFGLDRSSLNELIEDEFGAELDLCRANPEMLRQYLDMKRAGHRVGFISDTYWNSEQLGRLLRSCSPGLTWDFLYASCDHGSSKSEALFKQYLSATGPGDDIVAKHDPRFFQNAHLVVQITALYDDSIPATRLRSSTIRHRLRASAQQHLLRLTVFVLSPS